MAGNYSERLKQPCGSQSQVMWWRIRYTITYLIKTNRVDFYKFNLRNDAVVLLEGIEFECQFKTSNLTKYRK